MRYNLYVNPIWYQLQIILRYLCIIIQIREPPSRVPNIMDGDAVPLLNESNIYTLERLRTLWPGVSYIITTH